MTIRRALGALSIAVLASGCMTLAPPYPASTANATSAAALGAPVALGTFKHAPGREADLKALRARAQMFASPVNDSYADYVAGAVRADLAAGGKLDAGSPRVLSGVLERNEVSADSLLKNSATVTVTFRLDDARSKRFEKSMTSTEEWESAYLGSIAIPRAIQHYVATVQKLIGQLFSDPDFIAATKP